MTRIAREPARRRRSSRQRAAQGAVGLERRRPRGACGRSGRPASPRLARDPREDRQAVEPAQLLLAAQARVEDLRARRRAAMPRIRPASSAAAMLSLRGETGELGGVAGVCSASSGLGPPRSVSSSAIWPLSAARRRAVVASSCALEAGEDLVDVGRAAPRCARRSPRGERVGESLRLLGRCRRLGGDRDDVDSARPARRVTSSSSSRGASRRSRAPRLTRGRPRCRDQPRGGLDVARRVGGLADQRQADRRRGRRPRTGETSRSASAS